MLAMYPICGAPLCAVPWWLTGAASVHATVPSEQVPFYVAFTYRVDAFLDA